MTITKIAITDDETLFRKGLFMIIEDMDNMEVLLEAGHGQDLLNQLEDLTSKDQDLPDIVLLDLQMPVLNGIKTAKLLQANYPDIKIIVLSTHFNKAFILNMIELGAASYLAKNTNPEEMEMTIQSVAEKGFHYNDEIMKIITENMRNKTRPKASFSEQLTNREQEILQLICEQMTANEIAEKLFISRRTVEGHRNNLLMKLNCRNIAGLVAYAVQNSLVEIKLDQYW
jgi:DNA-binding NarL/FixJ family response regulator